MSAAEERGIIFSILVISTRYETCRGRIVTKLGANDRVSSAARSRVSGIRQTTPGQINFVPPRARVLLRMNSSDRAELCTMQSEKSPRSRSPESLAWLADSCTCSGMYRTRVNYLLSRNDSGRMAVRWTARFSFVRCSRLRPETHLQWTCTGAARHKGKRPLWTQAKVSEGSAPRSPLVAFPG
jgi:hypothetical protein